MLSSTYPVHVSASEVNRSGADTQVTSYTAILLSFHPFVEQLSVFHTPGLVLASSSILRVLNLDLRLHHDGIMSGTCQRCIKLCINPYISIVNPLQTYIHTYIHTYIRTYIHTYIHTYIYTYIHTYIHALANYNSILHMV